MNRYDDAYGDWLRDELEDRRLDPTLVFDDEKYWKEEEELEERMRKYEASLLQLSTQ